MVIDLFTKKEIEGRDKAINLFPKLNLVESEDRFEVWDLSGQTTDIAGGEHSFFIEVKDRDIASDSYKSIFLEFSKYQHLLKISEANNDADIFYLNFFNNDEAFIYNLKKLKVSELKLSVQTVNKTTVGSSYKVDKIMIELPCYTAKKYII